MTAVPDVGPGQEAVAVINGAIHGQFRDALAVINESPDVWHLACSLGGIAAAMVGALSDASGASVDEVLARMGEWAERMRLEGL